MDASQAGVAAWPAERGFDLALVQHAPDLWSAEHHFGWVAGLVEIPVRMTVIRLADGQLILHSPVPISAAVGDEVDALGTVGFIVVPEAHGKFTAEASQRYPSAQLLAAAGIPRQQRALGFSGSLADAPPAAWDEQVDTHFIEGFRLNEVALFHRASNTLVITDLCFNIRRTSSRVARLFFRANGMWQHFGPSRIIRRVGVSDRAAFQRSLDRLQGWNAERIVPGHGDVIENPLPGTLHASWGRSQP